MRSIIFFTFKIPSSNFVQTQIIKCCEFTSYIYSMMNLKNNFLCIFILSNLLYCFVSAIDCFKCVSINHDYQPCEDPFHNNYTVDIFESPCMGGRKGRDGLFPATSCVKITGVFEDNGDILTVRGCALDSGTLTTDTEIVRMSHCGGFFYDDRYAEGCVQSCNDAEACNSAIKFNISILAFILFITIIYL